MILSVLLLHVFLWNWKLRVRLRVTVSELKLAYSEFYADKKQPDLVVTEGDDTDSDSDDDTRNDVVTENVPQGHRIIDMDTLNTNISDKLVCAFCHSTVMLIEVSRHGLSSTLAFHCSNKKCDDQNAFPTSALISVGNLTIHSMNRRAVLVMRSIGRDRADLQSFCGVMDLPPPVHYSTYNKIDETLEKAACTVQDQSMQRAAEREYAQAEPIENDEVHDMDVSSDGSWMTPGHSSKVGIVTTIGCKTGQVVDAGTRSTVCKSCQVWKKRNSNTASYRRWEARNRCTRTHSGVFGVDGGGY